MSDDEIERKNESDKMDVDDGEFDSDLGDEEIDEELALPPVLVDIGYSEKRELLRFKRTHNERDWEEEILRRSDLLARKVDMERLKRMAGKGSIVEKAATTRGKTTPRGKRSTKIESDEEDDEESEVVQTKRRRVTTVTKSSEVEEGEEEEEKVSDASDDEEDDDDELFDSEEEEEISKRHKQQTENEVSSKKSKTLGGKKSALKAEKDAPRRSGRKVSRDSDEEEDADSEDEPRRKPSRTTISSSGKKVSKRRAGGLEEYEDLQEDEYSSDEDEREARAQLEAVDESAEGSLEFYLRIQQRRFMIERYLKEPYVETMLVGSFIRLTIGEIEQKPVYRMCEIIGLQYNTSPYVLPDSGKPCTTRLTVSVAGQTKKGIKIAVVSNSRINMQEFVVFKQEMEKAGLKLLTENQINARRTKQLQLTKHVYTHQEIQEMVARNNGKDKSKTTEYSTAMESLLKLKEEAREQKDLDALEAVQKTIDQLERESARQKKLNEEASRHHIEVNKRSRESNVQRDMAAGMRKRQEELEAAAKGKLSNAVLDPFLRRETRPKILWNTGSKLSNEKEKENNNGVAAKEATVATATTVSAAAAAEVNSSMATTAKDSGALWTVTDAEPTFEEICKRMKQRLGVDLLALSQQTPRERYLAKVCAGLPPLGSAERNALRNGCKSLDEVIEAVRLQREPEGDTMLEQQ